MISLGSLLADADRIKAGRGGTQWPVGPPDDGEPRLSTAVLDKDLEEERAVASNASLAALLCHRAQNHAGWDTDAFAEEQTGGLIRQVFCPGWPRPSRQVVFSAVEQSGECAEVCARVACQMAHELPGTVCAVEAYPNDPCLEEGLAAVASTGDCNSQPPKLHGEAFAVSHHLWLLRSASFVGQYRVPQPAGWLRSRLSELRREFDYTVIHAPPAVSSSETALLGQLSDGIILVLRAHKTRRVVARRAKEMLQAANVRVLGFVLDRRTFPIPEVMYRSL